MTPRSRAGDRYFSGKHNKLETILCTFEVLKIPVSNLRLLSLLVCITNTSSIINLLDYYFQGLTSLTFKLLHSIRASKAFSSHVVQSLLIFYAFVDSYSVVFLLIVLFFSSLSFFNYFMNVLRISQQKPRIIERDFSLFKVRRNTMVSATGYFILLCSFYNDETRVLISISRNFLLTAEVFTILTTVFLLKFPFDCIPSYICLTRNSYN